MKVYFSKILLSNSNLLDGFNFIIYQWSEGERFFLDVELPLVENSKYLVLYVLSMEDKLYEIEIKIMSVSL